jgi:hypothetical protein
VGDGNALISAILKREGLGDIQKLLDLNHLGTPFTRMDHSFSTKLDVFEQPLLHFARRLVNSDFPLEERKGQWNTALNHFVRS